MSIAQHYSYIIIGGGIAGLSAIKAIREHDLRPILLLSNEDRLPYKRTQINKLLSKGFTKDEMAIHDEAYYQQNSIDLLYEQVEAIHPDTKTISTHQRSIAFDKLLIATGQQPRTTDFQHIPNDRLLTIYKAVDSEKLIQFAQTHNHFLILGGGVEGVEMAYQLRLMQKSVTLIHNSEHIMNRQFSPVISNLIEQTLRENSVEIIKSADYSIEFTNGKISLRQSQSLNYFYVIIECIGATPNIQLAVKAGLKTQRGICVNQYFQTSAKDIFAAGDVAQLFDGSTSGLWHFAEHQGEMAGKNMCGQTVEYTPKQFRLKTEIFNQFFFSMNYNSATNYESTHCDSSKERYRELYLHHNQLVAVLMVNDKENAKQYEKAVREGWSFEQISKQLPF